MTHDVFISHSSGDKLTADAICHVLEQNGISCWIAPRDVRAGFDYPAEIMFGIENCKLMVMIFSEKSNNSPFVYAEVERTFSMGKMIIPYRLSQVEMSMNLKLLLAGKHWIDAYPNDTVFAELIKAVKNALGISVVEKTQSYPETQESKATERASILAINPTQPTELSQPINLTETMKWNLAGESFNIPVGFKTSTEKIWKLQSSPQGIIHLQTNERYFIQITERVGKFGFSPASSAEDWAANTQFAKTAKITIAGKPFYKQHLLLSRISKDDEYLHVVNPEAQRIKISSQGNAIDSKTNEIVDKNPRLLTSYVFDLGENIFAIALEDKIPNHDELIKIFLGLPAPTPAGNNTPSGTNGDVYGNSVGNSMCKGLYVTYKDKLFYAVSGKIYRENPDGSERSEILNTNQSYIYCLNIADDNLYFASASGIFKAGINGSGMPLIKLFACLPLNLLYYNKFLYFIVNGQLQCIDFNCKSHFILSSEGERCSYFTIFDDWIFYSYNKSAVDDWGTIAKIRTDGAGKAIIEKNKHAMQILADKDYIYYFSMLDALYYRMDRLHC